MKKVFCFGLKLFIVNSQALLRAESAVGLIFGIKVEW